MPREEFPIVLSDYITVCFTHTKDSFGQHAEEPVMDKEFWEPHWDTDYDSDEF